MPITAALEARGYVVSIGQLTPEDLRELNREIRAGRVTKCRAPWAGCLVQKTHYVSDPTRFAASQAESAEHIGRCIRVDAAVAEGRLDPAPFSVPAAGLAAHVQSEEARIPAT